MLHLQNVFFGCDIVRRIVRRNRCRVLGDDFTTVYLITYVMDRHTGFGLPRCLDRFVNMMSVHSHTSELGEQCGMQIDHLVFISIDKKIRDDEQEAGEYDEIDAELLHERHHVSLVIELFFRNHDGRDSEVLGAHQRIGIGTVAENEGDFHVM